MPPLRTLSFAVCLSHRYPVPRSWALRPPRWLRARCSWDVRPANPRGCRRLGISATSRGRLGGRSWRFMGSLLLVVVRGPGGRNRRKRGLGERHLLLGEVRLFCVLTGGF